MIENGISMKNRDKKTHSLLEIARLAMLSRGLEPDFSESALQELAGISECAVEKRENLIDLKVLDQFRISNLEKSCQVTRTLGTHC